MKKHLIVALLATLSLSATEAPTKEDLALLKAASKTFNYFAEQATPAVVSIQVETSMDATSGEIGPRRPHPMDPFGDDFFRQFFPPGMHNIPVIGQGSGFLVSEDGHILTNNHIVGDAKRIQVTLSDKREYKAEVVGTDPKSDLAVIKIDEEDLPYLTLGDSDEIAVAEWVLAIGAPFGLEATVTQGIVSGKQRNQLGITESDDFIQTDAAINPGNSGGPLLNLEGKVIGINTAILTRSGGSLGVGLAIPSNLAKRVTDQLIAKGRVTRGYLGLSLQAVDGDLAQAFGLDKPKGALVTEVLPDSPAEKAGIEAGDVILSINGKPIDSINSLRNAVSLMEPGEKATVTLIRSGKTEKKSVEIGTHPHSAGNGQLNKLGLELLPLTDRLRQELGLGTSEQGVVIASVKAGSGAAKARLTPGTLIVKVGRVAVTSPEEVAEAIEALSKEGNQIPLLVRQGPYTRYVVLRL